MEAREPGNLEEQVAELRARVRRLEGTLQDYGIALREEAELRATGRAAVAKPGEAGTMTAAAAPAEAHPEAAGAQGAGVGAGPGPQAGAGIGASETVAAARAGMGAAPAQVPVRPPQFAPVEPAKAGEDRSLESRIGSQWFNRIGILAVLIAAAWFLKLAIDNHWIGPLGRVLIGLVAGAALVAWSERFRTHGYKGFSYSLKAVGSGVLYLSLWAAFSLYGLVDSGVAFAAMVAVTAFNGFLSWVQDAELLALYAIVGGFSTPLLLSTGVNHEVALFTYLLLLDGAVLALVALKPWSRLLCASFLGTVFFFASWSVQYYAQNEFGTTAFFLGVFFLIFAWAPRLVRVQAEGGSSHPAWDNLALVVVPLANAALGYLGFYLMLEKAASGDAAPWVAVAFAAFYLLLLRLPARGAIHGSTGVVTSLHLTIAVVFLIIAIPLKTHGRWLTIGWLAEGAALMWLARRVGTLLLTVLGGVCLVLGLIALVTLSAPASLTPIFNERFGTYLFAIAVCALVARLAAKAPAEAQREPAIAWRQIAAVAVLAVNALILLAVGLEIHNYWWAVQYHPYATGRQRFLVPEEWRQANNYRMYAQFTYSAFFMLFGAVLLALGFWRRSAFLRWQALVLLAVSIAKVFTVDVSALSQGYRILSFLGLGALLLAVSFVYQRDWLNLRKTEHKTT
jgi:uncharacterized membrane protein